MATLTAVLVTSMGILSGAGEGVGTEEARVESQEALPLCTVTYVIDYYASQTYVDRVGEDFCVCGEPLRRWGQVTPYSLVLYWESCETGVERPGAVGE